MRGLLFAVGSGLLMALALPLAIPFISLSEIDPAGHLELVSWFALVPVLFAVARASTFGRAFGLGFVAGLAYFYAAIWWVNHAMTVFGGVPWPIAFLGLTLLVAFMAFHWAAALSVSWLIRRRLGWPMHMHLPAVFAAFEFCRNYLCTGFPWGNLGYTQVRHLAMAQLASVTGIYGIAALVVLVNCVLHALVEARVARRSLPWRAAAATAALLAFAFAFGRVHLASVRERASAAPKLWVALVQGNVSQSVKNNAIVNGTEILHRYLPLTLKADGLGADLIAWPESAYPFFVPAKRKSLSDRRTGLPRLRRAHLLLGAEAYLVRRAPDGRSEEQGANSVFLLRPDLSVIGIYSKHHLVPFGEYVPLASVLGRFLRSVVPEMIMQSPGSELTVLQFPESPPDGVVRAPGQPDLSQVRLAPMICFDAIFPEVNVAYARQDPEILVNPTNDAWYGYSSGPYQFLAMVRMRAIEAGKAVVRPAYAGVSALIDPSGEVQPGALPLGPVDPELAPSLDQPPRLLMGKVPRLRGRTLYTTFGDLFAWAASLYGAAVLAIALFHRGRGVPPGTEG